MVQPYTARRHLSKGCTVGHRPCAFEPGFTKSPISLLDPELRCHILR